MAARPSLLLPRLALLAACAIWGVAFTVVQRGLRDMPVFHHLALRFALGTLGAWERRSRRPRRGDAA